MQAVLPVECDIAVATSTSAVSVDHLYNCDLDLAAVT